MRSLVYVAPRRRPDPLALPDLRAVAELFRWTDSLDLRTIGRLQAPSCSCQHNDETDLPSA
jgi:hypothetical protein